MKFKLTASAVFCAASLLGCSSAPTMAVPTGEWEDFTQASQPQAFAPIPAISPAAYNQGPATTVYKPTQVAAFTPPKTPGSTAVKPAVPAIVLPVMEKAPAAAPVPASPVKPVAPLPNQASIAPAVPVPVPSGQAVTPAPAKVVSIATAGKPATVPATADQSKASLGNAVGHLASTDIKLAPPAPKPPKAWVVSTEDKTIRGTLTKWAAIEGYAFNPKGPDYWTFSGDFDVVANDTMYGDFKDVVRRLIASTELTKTPLQPCFYKNRAVRVILFNEECGMQAFQVRNP